MNNCAICSKSLKSLKGLAIHISCTHKISTEEYYIQYLSKNKPLCKCGAFTKFLDINRGFRTYCSNKCSSIEKAKSLEYREKISLSQKGIPRKKHSNDTKLKIAVLSKNNWLKNRDNLLKIFRSPEYRERASRLSSLYCKARYITYVQGIRCDSSHEESFVLKCLEEKIPVKRFSYENSKSIKLGKKWYVPDFIINDKNIVEVKDFHIWFKKELVNNMSKYRQAEEWAILHNVSFSFWFKSLGFMSIKETENYYKEYMENK